VVVVGTDRPARAGGPREDLPQREVRVSAAVDPQRVPRRHPVLADVAGQPSALERLEDGFEPIVHRLTVPNAKLGLGGVYVVRVDRLDAEPLERAVQGPLDGARCEGVRAGEVGGLDEPGVDEALANVRCGVRRPLAREREEPALAREDDRLAVDSCVA